MFLLHINSVLDDLKFEEDTSKRFENAIAEIFNALGFIANQPERETGKGPDDFVALGDNRYLVIECKNESITETIDKDDCNQLNGSYIWFNNLYKDDEARAIPIMIHNSNIFEYACSPNKEIRVMTPEFLEKYKNSIRSFVIACCQIENYKNVEKINNLLIQYKLRASDFVENYTNIYKVKSR